MKSSNIIQIEKQTILINVYLYVDKIKISGIITLKIIFK